MAMTQEHITEYRTAVQSYDQKGRELVNAAWELGDLFRRDNYSAEEIAQNVGRGVKWVRNRLDIARLSRSELSDLMDKHGVDSMHKIRMELVRLNLATRPNNVDAYPKIQYMPIQLIMALSDQGYDAAALRNLMKRIGIALESQVNVVAHVLDHPESAGKTQINLQI